MREIEAYFMKPYSVIRSALIVLAVILTWCATADCLRRRIYDLALEGDALAQQLRDELRAIEGQSYYEENLIAAARKCELIDDYEERALTLRARYALALSASNRGDSVCRSRKTHPIYLRPECSCPAWLSRHGFRQEHGHGTVR